MIVQNLIYEIRGQKVMLDFDLARLYHVETKVLNQAVKRNAERFPSDFMFRLTAEEVLNMRSQFVTASMRRSAGHSGVSGSSKASTISFSSLSS